MINETAIMDVALATAHITLHEFEVETFDDRHDILFDNEQLTEWWDKFWHDFAVTVAISAVPSIVNKKGQEKRTE